MAAREIKDRARRVRQEQRQVQIELAEMSHEAELAGNHRSGGRLGQAAVIAEHVTKMIDRAVGGEKE